MDIIVPHVRTDFDAFASMLLARKIFPRSVPVLPSTMIYKLRELLSLYRDVTDFKNLRYLKKIKNPALETLIVVDTKKYSQLSEFEKYLSLPERIMIFDHHPSTSDDITDAELVQFPYGANTTGLFFRLMDLEEKLAPQEATIALLGIYADTGNLTFPGTTPEDALAVSHLLKMEADLKTVNYYLRPYFDPAQREIFRDMLSTAEEMELDGYKVVLLKQMLDRPLPNMSVMVNQVSDMVGADAIMGVFASKAKSGVQMIIQSVAPEINAGRLAGFFGGGGHPGAAAAYLPDGELDNTSAALMDQLLGAPLATIKVKDLMTSPVVTVLPKTPLTVTVEILRQGKIRGAPVLDDAGRLVGMITGRDVEKAQVQDRMNVPTSAIMSRKVVTLGPETPLALARKLIAHRDIGHIPIVDQEETLIGIISRSDVLGNNRNNSDPS